MSSDSPPPSGLDTVKKTTEAIATFIQWLAELIQRRNWFTLLLLLDAVLILFFNPGSIVPKFFKDFFSWELPKQYPAFFWFTVGGILLAALIIAVRTMPRLQTEAVDFRERKAIKGLRPFGVEDAEIFTRLQRNRSLKDCFEKITESEFRFGILVGESGCGKTSFLQAGLCPKLASAESSDRGIYIKFTNRPPIDTIRKAFTADLPLLPEEVETVDFLSLLNLGVEAASKPLLLLFDQFEQFFAHFKRKEDREPFINALRDWYISDLPVKVLISIRADLKYRLDEVQQTLDYSLSLSNNFPLKKFSPDEATKVLRAIAETEKLQFDDRFITELAERELASREDGLISPVDLQILSWMIERQNADELRAFNKVAFQKLGGVEGLLTRFLDRTLEVKPTSKQDQSAVKVLLALTDLERQVRVGVLTVADLQEKLKDSLRREEVEKVTRWLAQGDVRLITSVEREGIIGYELAHELLIPALMGLAGKKLSETDRANQLLERRVNEWLGNQRNSRYLFGWRELRLIERHKPYLNWEKNRRQKQQLLIQSKKRWYRLIWAMIITVLLLLSFLFWWYSPWGQFWQIKRDLVHFSRRVDDGMAREAAVAFAKDENLAQALEICDKEIQNPQTQAETLIGMAEVAEKLNQSNQVASLRQKAVPLLQKALDSAQTLEEAYQKADILRAIAEAIGKLNQSDKAIPLLQKALDSAQTLEEAYQKADVLWAITEVIGKLKQPNKAVPLLQKALDSAQTLEEAYQKADVLRVIAESIGKLKQPNKAVPLLQKALDSAQMLDSFYRADASSAIAEAYIKLNQVNKAVFLLQDTLASTQAMKDDDSAKGRALGVITDAISKLNQVNKASLLLKDVLNSVQKIKYSYFYDVPKYSDYTPKYSDYTPKYSDYTPKYSDYTSKYSDYTPLPKVYALRVIAESYINLNQPDKAVSLLQQTLDSAQTIEDSDQKTEALRAIAESIGKLKQPNKAVPLLQKAFYSAQTIEDSNNKTYVLWAITEAYIKLKQPDKAVPLLQKALDSAQTIERSDNKASALRAIAESIGKLKQPDKAVPLLQKALDSAQTIEYSDDRASALSMIAEAQAKLSKWRQAREAFEKCPTDVCKVESLAKILTVRAEQVHPELKEEVEERGNRRGW